MQIQGQPAEGELRWNGPITLLFAAGNNSY